jgi:hypothetical protein
MKKICFALIVILLFVFSVQSKEHALEALFFSYATYTKDEKEIRQWTCGWCQKISDVTVVDIHSEIGSNTRATVATTPKFRKFSKFLIQRCCCISRFGELGKLVQQFDCNLYKFPTKCKRFQSTPRIFRNLHFF